MAGWFFFIWINKSQNVGNKLQIDVLYSTNCDKILNDLAKKKTFYDWDGLKFNSVAAIAPMFSSAPVAPGSNPFVFCETV